MMAKLITNCFVSLLSGLLKCLSWKTHKVFIKDDAFVRKGQFLHVYLISMAAFE